MVVFGSPTHRDARNGYWSAPKSAKTSDGREVVIRPSAKENGDPNWKKPVVVAPEGAKIISVEHLPGYHGGSYQIEVAVPPPESSGI